MKKLVWFITGVAAGFVAAHFVNKDPRGREALAELDARVTEFTERMTDAYRSHEAELTGSSSDTADN